MWHECYSSSLSPCLLKHRTGSVSSWCTLFWNIQSISTKNQMVQKKENVGAKQEPNQANQVAGHLLHEIVQQPPTKTHPWFQWFCSKLGETQLLQISLQFLSFFSNCLWQKWIQYWRRKQAIHCPWHISETWPANVRLQRNKTDQTQEVSHCCPCILAEICLQHNSSNQAV